MEQRAQVDQQAVSRRAHERRGRFAEWIAAGLLLLKGYRILERRARTHDRQRRFL